MWQMQSYGSGTVIVKSEYSDYPHLYVYGYDENHRREIAIDLEIFLNHARKLPDWVNGLQFHPNDENTLYDGKGISIQAIGPMVLPPDDNGALNWQVDMSDKAKYDRKFLINRIFDSSSENTHTEISDVKKEMINRLTKMAKVQLKNVGVDSNDIKMITSSWENL